MECLMPVKRVLVATLALLLAASFATPTGARALSAGGFEYIVTESGATVIRCAGSCPATLTIPSTLDGHPVTSIGNQAFKTVSLASVTIPDSVTSIGNRAFDGSGLTSVTIPNSVTSLDDYAFASNFLTSLMIPDSVLAIGYGAFFNNRLSTVTFGASVTSIGGESFYSNALTVVEIPRSVTSVGWGAFAGNTLEYIYFLGDAPSVEDNVFASNPNLDEVSRYSAATGWGETWGTKAVVTYPSVRAAARRKPTVTGTTRVGKTLTAAKGTWSGTPTPTITFQWYACTKAVSAARTTVTSTCKKISGATRSTFKLTTAQRGKYVAVLVKGTTHRMTPTSWLSKTTAKVR
jgi:hypothetical protein